MRGDGAEGSRQNMEAAFHAGVGTTRRSWCFWARGVMPGDRVIIKFKKEGEVLVAEAVRKLR